MVAVSTGEYGRHAAFFDYFNLLDKPAGTVCSFVHGQSPAKGRNMMIDTALDHDCTHIFLLDDDMIYPPDTLTKLLKHDLDIVSAYYVMRTYPHMGLIFDYMEPDGKNHWYEVQPTDTGLKQVSATGFGCCLIKMHVFEQLCKPFVRLGEIEKDGWCDDIGFFNRVANTGIKAYVDLDIPVGHIASVVVTPIKREDDWHVTYNTFGSESISFPMIRRPKDAGTDVARHYESAR